MMLLQLFLALMSTAGFCLVFNIPRRHIAIASFIGGCGRITYEYALLLENSVVTSCFFAACAVTFLSEVFCRFFKETATVFVIPGILPLVPGAGMYYTMRAFLSGDLSGVAETGSRTLLMAGSIALGILVMSSVVWVAVLIKDRIRQKDGSSV